MALLDVLPDRDNITPVHAAAGVLAATLAAYGLYTAYDASRLPLPPGPPPKLISGNGHNIPHTLPWLAYQSWTELYGPIVTFRIYTKRFLVLNAAKPTLDLLDGRSAVYSERPESTMLSELAGRKWSPTLINASNPRFRTYRRLFHSGLAPRATRTYFSSIERESEQLLRGLARLSREEDGGGKGAFVKLLRRNAGAVILRATYGWEVKSDDDELVKAIEKAFELGAVLVGKPWMVDIIPALRFVPEWAPFASFQTRARQFREQTLKVGTIPLAFTKEHAASGTGIECFASKLLAEDIEGERNEEKESIIKEVCSSLYSGGADTTVSGLTSFILLMTLHPSIQTRIQTELDTIIGTSRLPLCTDTPNLPYLQAVFKEVLRWAPPARICVPHVLKEDDVYAGYRIPKGTTVIANIHAIMRDEKDWADPEMFDPERFFGKEEGSVPDPRKFAFGFGRRICPGAHFAEQSMLLNMARIMAVFRIEKARGPDGEVVEPTVEWTTNIVSHAKPFECRFVPRSEEALALLAEE